MPLDFSLQKLKRFYTQLLCFYIVWLLCDVKWGESTPYRELLVSLYEIRNTQYGILR